MKLSVELWISFFIVRYGQLAMKGIQPRPNSKFEAIYNRNQLLYFPDAFKQIENKYDEIEKNYPDFESKFNACPWPMEIELTDEEYALILLKK